MLGQQRFGEQTRNTLTVPQAQNYSFPMTTANQPADADVELKKLENRLDELIALVHQLKEENRALRARQDALATEKTALLNRNDQVRTRVEAMIGRLKAMEHSA
jgi:cell division protein ZapB